MPSLLSPAAPISPDLRDFLASYPSQRALPATQTPNYSFYSAPADASFGVINMQDELRGDWDMLEWKHDFVQWLFPIREQGMNPRARPLQPHEVGLMIGNEEVLERLRDSYKIMLAFYGLRLVDPVTGELDVTEDTSEEGGWPARFYNLETSMHNYLRITRILKCLHELSLPHYVPSFLLFILALQHPAPGPSNADSQPQPRLRRPGLMKSMDGYWRHCIRDEPTREWVRSVIAAVRRGERDWGNEEYRRAVRRFAGTGVWGDEQAPKDAGKEPKM